MYLTVFEIFDRFDKETTKEGRINCLRNHGGEMLKRVLRAAFHPNIKFFLKTAPPNWNPQTHLKTGMGDYKMEYIVTKFYLFEVGHPRAAKELTDAKRMKLLVQYLEGLEAREAAVLLGIMFKSIDVKYLTYNLVKEAFPDILP